jgi:hypothetical protein
MAIGGLVGLLGCPSCVNPQYHLHVGERHEHGQVQQQDGTKQTGDALENDPRWNSLKD